MVSQPLPDVPNAIMIKISGLLSGQPWVNILHAVHDASTANATDLQTLCATINNSWGTNIKALCTTSCSMTAVAVTDISSRTGATASLTTPTQVGTLGNPAPNNVSYAVGWVINRRYRGGHPRTYHPGLSTNQLNGNTQVSAATRTAMIAGYNALKANIEGGALASMPNLRLCQVSYFHGKGADGKPLLRPTPLVDLISQAKGDLRLDSQRHRLGRPV